MQLVLYSEPLMVRVSSATTSFVRSFVPFFSRIFPSRQYRLGAPCAVAGLIKGAAVSVLFVALVHGEPDYRNVLVGGPARDQSLDQRLLAALGGICHIADDDLVRTASRIQGLIGELL